VNGPTVGGGTEFRLVAEFLGRKNELTYRIVEYDPPYAVTFGGENATVVSRDRITFEAIDAGTRVTYDGELAKQHTFLVVAFRREQQRVIDQWLPWLIDLEQRRSDVAVYELPVLSSMYGPVRWFIDGGMTRGIPEAAARARTITVYTDVGKVVDNLGLAGTDTIAVLIVEPSGRILARETGGFEDQKVDRLAAALAPEPSSRAAAA
jgi:hypothetical protein